MIICADVHEGLAALPAEAISCCITSPPYWGLRDYGTPGQIGLEDTPEQYVERLVGVFREVRRVLRDDGTLWLNIGDSYITAPHGAGDTHDPKWPGGRTRAAETPNRRRSSRRDAADVLPPGDKRAPTLKPKDLVGTPWMLAFALRADGWWLRSDIVWHKPNAMPESVEDRPTRAHEFLFLLAKSRRYHFDRSGMNEPAERGASGNRERRYRDQRDGRPDHHAAGVPWTGHTRNRRDVWSVPTQPFPGAHFATFPEALIEPCVLAGSPPGGVVLDCFGGSGTVGRVARRHGRRFVLIERNPAYCAMAIRRQRGVQRGLPLGGEVATSSQARHADPP